ncbi:hypothetical protein ACSNOG_31805, partial [Streptomyces sp. URMC 124]
GSSSRSTEVIAPNSRIYGQSGPAAGGAGGGGGGGGGRGTSKGATGGPGATTTAAGGAEKLPYVSTWRGGSCTVGATGGPGSAGRAGRAGAAVPEGTPARSCPAKYVAGGTGPAASTPSITLPGGKTYNRPEGVGKGGNGGGKYAPGKNVGCGGMGGIVGITISSTAENQNSKPGSKGETGPAGTKGGDGLVVIAW